MEMEDKQYLIQKEHLELTNNLNHYRERRNLYQHMIDTMINYNVRNSQERFLFIDLQKLVNFFESKIDIVEIKLKDVENAPVYNGCEELLIEETRECFNNKVSEFIKREFNLIVSKSLNLSEPKLVEAFFIINENGNLTGMKVRNSEVTIQAEILRVLRKMPVMKPATHNGESVSVLCSIIVKYGNNVEVDVVYIPERPD